MVKINGENLNLAGKTVLAAARELGFKDGSYVVEYNLEILKKENYEKTILKDDDSLELVQFMGGG